MTIPSSARSRRFYVMLAASFILAATYSVAAQPTPVDVSIRGITANRLPNTGWEVFVDFSKNFNPENALDRAGATNPANYKITNANTGVAVPVDGAQFVIDPNSTVNLIRLEVRKVDAFNAKDFFHLYAFNLTFEGAAAKGALQLPITVRVEAERTAADQTTTPPTTKPTPTVPKPVWGFKESKNRDDSDLYASWELTSARHTARTGTGDVKVAIPFFKNFWKRTSKFSPLVEIKASSNHKADADSLKFALEWYLPLYQHDDPDEKFPYVAVDWINTGKIEAPKNFDNINAVWESRWLFPSAKFPRIPDRVKLYIDPFVGHEFGKNLRSPLPEADGKGIARLYAGANLVVDIPFKSVKLLKGVHFDASYIRRWPLKRELTIEDAGDGKINLLTFGKGPKEYVTSKFTFKVNEFFGPYVGYEWGSIPPVYKFVDHKWTFGLLFKSKIRVP